VDVLLHQRIGRLQSFQLLLEVRHRRTGKQHDNNIYIYFTLGLNPSFSANPPPPQPFLFLLQDSLYVFPRLFAVTSEHIRLFTF